MTHCSILGTCLTLGELRKAVVKIAGDSVRSLGNYDIHSLAVRYAGTQGTPSKTLNKVLDDKYAGAIRRLQKAESEEELRAAWTQARSDGAIESHYWAISTHPLASQAFFYEVFGDVHMLSHLVGASNRADVRSLSRLEEERDALITQVAHLRKQLAEGWSKRDRELQQLRDALARRVSGDHAADVHAPTAPESALPRLARSLQKQLEHEHARASKLETDLAAARTELTSLRERLEKTGRQLIALNNEVEELEAREEKADALATRISGRTVLYVGGLARGARFIRSAVEGLGCEFLYHDGGLEQANILLRGLVGRADIVLLALDFVSHDAAHLCKRLAQQHGKTFVPLPHAGVGSVLRALREAELPG